MPSDGTATEVGTLIATSGSNSSSSAFPSWKQCLHPLSVLLPAALLLPSPQDGGMVVVAATAAYHRQVSQLLPPTAGQQLVMAASSQYCFSLAHISE